jgi:nitrate/nitrite transporter NarK
MLSVLLGCAFVSRQFWGFLADRIGGPRTILAGSACQITAMIGFLLAITVLAFCSIDMPSILIGAVDPSERVTA